MEDADHTKDGQKDLEDMTSLVLQQKNDHESELQRRDEMIQKLQDLFKEVEVKSASRESEHEQKIRSHMNSINNIRQKLQNTEKENNDLKEQLKEKTDEIDAIT